MGLACVLAIVAMVGYLFGWLIGFASGKAAREENVKAKNTDGRISQEGRVNLPQHTGATHVSTKPNLREALADLCHSQWSGWMKYLFSKCSLNPDGSVTIPKSLVERWSRQHLTEFSQLSEPEQNSDRTEADKFLLLLSHHSLDHKLPLNQDMKTVVPFVSPSGDVVHPNLDSDGYVKQL